MLSKLVSQESLDWDLLLNNVEFALNNTINRSIDDTPARLLFGVEQKGKLVKISY